MSEIKLIKKTQLGKKRFLGKPKKEPKEIKEEIILIDNSTNINKSQKENNASFLLKLILKVYYLSIWKNKVKSLRYFSRKTNKQRINFKKLIKEISLVINQHKSKYLNEIIEKIDNLPLPSNIKHDKNFGTLKIVNKEKNYRDYDNKNNNIEEYIEENNINKDIIYDEGSKQMDFNNNDFNENEYNTYENIEEDNYDKNMDYNNQENYNENEIEEDEAFIENEYDYNQDISNEVYYKNNNINDNNEYYQDDNYYNDIYDNNDDYYYDDNNNNDIYIENQYHYYYNSPNERDLYPYEERYYEPLNQVNYIKNKGNNVLISDIYIKPRIERNQSQYYYYNKNSNNTNNNYYYGYQNNNNINNFTNMNNRNYKRAFPSSSHNYLFYVSK